MDQSDVQEEEGATEQAGRPAYRADRILLERRGGHDRLGFALQVGTARFLRTFLADHDPPLVSVD